MTIVKSLAVGAVLSLALSGVSTAKVRNQTLYDKAQHLCYDDAMRLCKDDVPDEDKVQACMTAKRAQLSPECGKIFDENDKTP